MQNMGWLPCCCWVDSLTPSKTRRPPLCSSERWASGASWRDSENRNCPIIRSGANFYAPKLTANWDAICVHVGPSGLLYPPHRSLKWSLKIGRPYAQFQWKTRSAIKGVNDWVLLVIICLRYVIKLGRLYLPINGTSNPKEGQTGGNNLCSFNQQEVPGLEKRLVCTHAKPPKSREIRQLGFASLATATKFPQRSKALSAAPDFPTSSWVSRSVEGFGLLLR